VRLIIASSWSQDAVAEKLTYLDEKLLQLVFSHTYQAVLRCCCCWPQEWVIQQLLQITRQALQQMHTCTASCTSNDALETVQPEFFSRHHTYYTDSKLQMQKK